MTNCHPNYHLITLCSALPSPGLRSQVLSRCSQAPDSPGDPRERDHRHQGARSCARLVLGQENKGNYGALEVSYLWWWGQEKYRVGCFLPDPSFLGPLEAVTPFGTNLWLIFDPSGPLCARLESTRVLPVLTWNWIIGCIGTTLVFSFSCKVMI